MFKISKCKVLDLYDYYNIYEHIDKLKINRFLKNNKKFKKPLVFKSDFGFLILHKSTKTANDEYQVSYFNNKNEATGDKQFKTFKDAIKFIILENRSYKEIVWCF